jgi:hypothetical protein
VEFPVRWSLGLVARAGRSGWSLGLVSYGWDGATLSHAGYLRGLGAAGAYPGYSTGPLDGFRHLAADLAGPLRGFRDGDRQDYDRTRRTAAALSGRG